MRRFVLPMEFAPQLISQAQIKLPEAVLHHVRVLRLVAETEIVLVCGETMFRATLLGDGTARVLDEVHAVQKTVRITLVQALSRSAKIDELVRVATEIGVQRIELVAAERSVVQLEARDIEKRRERWQRIADEAARQAETLPPALVVATSLRDWVRAFVAAPDKPVLFVSDARAGTSFPMHIAAEQVVLVVGPEGGLSESELSELVGVGAHVVSFPTGVLRTEHAGPIGIAILRQLCAFSESSGADAGF